MNLKELLKDPIYKAWYGKIPTEHMVGTFPWRVWVHTDKGWTRTKSDFEKYSQAYNWIAKRMHDYEDLVLYSKGHEFRPPVIRYRDKKYYWPCPAGYRWCGYCRRPTLFGTFTRHHALTHLSDPVAPRCIICGARKKFQKQYESNLPASYYDRELAPKGTARGSRR
jgi:hypothetical protein